MSEQQPEAGTTEAVELPPQGDPAFASLMDTLVSDEEQTAGSKAGGEGAGGAAASAPAGGAGDAAAGQPAAADPAAAGTPGGAAPAAPADGSAGGAAAPGADGAAAGTAEQPAAGAGGGDRPADWTASSADLIPKLGQLSTAFEENTSKAYQAQALEAVRTDHANYFTALEKHPRLLVGTQVPAIGKEGMETLKDTNDAREWQEAVKSILVDEVRSRASTAMDESKDFMATVHQSIEMFQNNPDLVPGTKDFDVDLANKFAVLAKPYELRVDGKLQGYSIPVQPIIDSMREAVIAERAAKTAAPEGVTRPVTSPPSGAAPADPPQAGVQSKAGSSDQAEDFSTLFGTIGLPNLQI